ncbi:MAG: terminase large subunit [Clostridia bacterium]|nr:terminase large subunit [Clostridia bacterium]
MEMIYCKEIDEYIRYCEENPQKINEDRKLLIKNIVKPLLSRDDVFFDSDTYYKCIQYCEKWYYKLFPYQKFVYAFVFMYKDDIPIFKTFVILMGRGNGKDGMMAPLMNFLQSRLYGVSKYSIDIVAASEDQANDTFKVVYEMLEANKKKMEKYFYWNKEIIIDKKTKAFYRYNTSNAKTKDGKKDGAILFNEYHTYENYKQIKVFTSGLGKIKHSRVFIITTNGYVREGPLDELLKVCEQLLEGMENTVRYFPFLCRIDSKEEADNEECWIKANPSLEYMPNLYNEIKTDYEELKLFPSKKSEFMTKRMNMPEQKEEEEAVSWDLIKKTNKEVPNLEGKSCICGIDYASLSDFASVFLLFKKSNTYYGITHSWFCKNSKDRARIQAPINDWKEQGLLTEVDNVEINPELLCKWITEKGKKYNIKKVVLDNFRYALVSKALIEIGFDAKNKEKVKLVRPSDIAKIQPVVESTFVNQKIIWGDNPLMRWFTGNTKLVPWQNNTKVYGKIEPKSRKTDGFMAFVNTMTASEEIEEINENAQIFEAITF